MLKKIKGRKIFKTALVVFLFVFIIAINPYNIFNKTRAVIFTFTYPVQKSFSTMANKTYAFVETIGSIGDFKRENEYLMKENLRLRSEIAKLKDVARENEELRKQLEILPKEKFDMVASSVTARDIYRGNNWIVIDKGEKDGIKKDMAVVVADGVFVGKIEEVFYAHSRIIPITSPNINVNATTVETGAIGVVNGKYGLGILLDMVLQTDYLKVGDQIVTSEISQHIPRGLLIGKIEEIYPSEGYLFQRATVISPIDLSKLRMVFVIKNEK